MIKLFRNAAVAMSAMMLATAPALAQQDAVELTGGVELEQIVEAEDGTTTTVRVAPETIVPGDRLIFSTDYANNGAETVTDFVVTNPLPSAVRLAPDADDNLVVSVDGGQQWGTLDTLRVTGEDDNVRAASHEDVTHIRWTLAELGAGASGSLEFPAIIR